MALEGVHRLQGDGHPPRLSVCHSRIPANRYDRIAALQIGKISTAESRSSYAMNIAQTAAPAARGKCLDTPAMSSEEEGAAC